MNHRGTVLSLIAALLAASPEIQSLQAQTTDTTSVGQLRALDSLRTADPKEYELLKAVLTTVVQMTLGRLGFGPATFTGVADSSTAVAVRSFEIARQLPITGNPFTRQTYVRLNSDQAKIELAERPSLGSKRFLWSDVFLMAEGPWLMDGEPETAMTADIYCARDNHFYFGGSSNLGECKITWARLGVGFMTSRQLTLLEEHFEIERWDQAEIISKPRDYPCTRYALRINKLQESVVMTRSALSRTGDVCDALEVRDVITRLVRPEEWPAAGADGSDPFDLYNLGPSARAALDPKNWLKSRR